MRIALAQLNLTVGAIDDNAERITRAISHAEAEGAQLVALPECAVTGYPAEDLWLKRSFIAANRRALDRIARATGDVIAIVGFVDREDDRLFSAAAVCRRGEIHAIYRKQLLPNYGVFDENRYFAPGDEHVFLDTGAGIVGVSVCEDAWSPDGPVVQQGRHGAQIVVNINASPFHKGKLEERTSMLADRARRAEASIAYVNLVGGQDELVFDGGSVVLDPEGELVARLVQFEEDFAVVDVPLGRGGRSEGGKWVDVPTESKSDGPLSSLIATPFDEPDEVYRAICLCLADYVNKNGFEKVVIGLSGGIDSSLTTVIATDALGPDAVAVVALPSEFSTSHSVDDAKQLASNLGIDLIEIPIRQIYDAYLDVLTHSFGKTEMGLAEENIQARIRGNLLMAISNRYGHLVLATGNKSELACGYATLYGDMAGGFAVLKDVFKTEVYALAEYRNGEGEVIPEHVMNKPPSAELRPDQKDSDSLPEYHVLDPILEAYIEDDLSPSEIVKQGHDKEIVDRVVALVDRTEYKRRQAPPGPKVTTKAFGRDRRLPITNRYRETTDAPERSVGKDD